MAALVLYSSPASSQVAVSSSPIQRYPSALNTIIHPQDLEGARLASSTDAGFPSSQAEEHESDPSDGQQSQAESEAGDSVDDSEVSTDGEDDGASLQNFVVSQGSTNPSTQSSELTAVSTQGSANDEEEDDGDLEWEQHLAETNPGGAWGGGTDSDSDDEGTVEIDEEDFWAEDDDESDGNGEDLPGKDDIEDDSDGAEKDPQDDSSGKDTSNGKEDSAETERRGRSHGQNKNKSEAPEDGGNLSGFSHADAVVAEAHDDDSTIQGDEDSQYWSNFDLDIFNNDALLDSMLESSASKNVDNGSASTSKDDSQKQVPPQPKSKTLNNKTQDEMTDLLHKDLAQYGFAFMDAGDTSNKRDADDDIEEVQPSFKKAKMFQ
ncbi:hypothetical protein CF319_g4341 [Tilletia indica]|nr:hypothetical protein CF319_g4341 [Tilletia indica]